MYKIGANGWTVADQNTSCLHYQFLVAKAWKYYDRVSQKAVTTSEKCAMGWVTSMAGRICNSK